MSVALHVPRDHCLAPERVDALIGEGGRYGRMFDLPALAADESLLHELGAAGGFCAGGDRQGDARVQAGLPVFREDGVGAAELFDEARRALTWHYQWLIVNDFLPALVGPDLVDELAATGLRFYRPDGNPFIPLEFADAAYRYGHSQIRQLYQLQPDGPLQPVFPDLIGFGEIAGREVDWSLLFDVPGRPAAQRAKQIDGRLPRSLIELP